MYSVTKCEKLKEINRWKWIDAGAKIQVHIHKYKVKIVCNNTDTNGFIRIWVGIEMGGGSIRTNEIVYEKFNKPKADEIMIIKSLQLLENVEWYASKIVWKIPGYKRMCDWKMKPRRGINVTM